MVTLRHIDHKSFTQHRLPGPLGVLLTLIVAGIFVGLVFTFAVAMGILTWIARVGYLIVSRPWAWFQRAGQSWAKPKPGHSAQPERWSEPPGSPPHATRTPGEETPTIDLVKDGSGQWRVRD